MANDMNHIVNRKIKFVFDGEEYFLKKSVKIMIALEQKHNQIEKREQIENKKMIEAEKKGEEYISDFDYTSEMFDLICKSFELTVSKQFCEKVLSYEPSETEMMNLYRILNLMRSGKTQEEAEKIVLKNEDEEEIQEKKQ